MSGNLKWEREKKDFLKSGKFRIGANVGERKRERKREGGEEVIIAKNFPTVLSVRSAGKRQRRKTKEKTALEHAKKRKKKIWSTISRYDISQLF